MTTQTKEFLAFQERIDKELLTHRVITDNKYTAWFKEGEMSMEECRYFIVQFSVFSNLFLIAQLHKMINADSIEGLRASKEILANEIGVIFRDPNSKTSFRKVDMSAQDKDSSGDPDLVTTEGTIQGGTFKYEAAHFEWLCNLGEKIGLAFKDLGKRQHGTKSTLFFCDELVRLYGNPDYKIAQAASYAVENWAAAGFWKELIEGLTKFKNKHNIDMPLAFFTWHDKLEDQHAEHTQEELEEYFHENEAAIDQDAFIKHGNEMLDAVAVFWDGLNEKRA